MKYYQVKKRVRQFQKTGRKYLYRHGIVHRKGSKKLKLNRDYMDIVDYPRHLAFFTFGCRRNVNQDYKGTYFLLSRNRD